MHDVSFLSRRDPFMGRLIDLSHNGQQTIKNGHLKYVLKEK